MILFGLNQLSIIFGQPSPQVGALDNPPQEVLDLLIITDAKNSLGKALGKDGPAQTVSELLARGAKRNYCPLQTQSFTKNPESNKVG